MGTLAADKLGTFDDVPKLKLKNSKSARKRFKISSKGKLQRRQSRLNHFNARQDGAARRGGRSQEVLAKQNEKDIKNLMPYA